MRGKYEEQMSGDGIDSVWHRNAHITPGRGSSRDHSQDLRPILSASLGNEPEPAAPWGGYGAHVALCREIDSFKHPESRPNMLNSKVAIKHQ